MAMFGILLRIMGYGIIGLFSLAMFLDAQIRMGGGVSPFEAGQNAQLGVFGLLLIVVGKDLE